MKKIIVSTDRAVNYRGGYYLLMCDYEYNAFDYNGQQIKGLEFPGENIPTSYREGSDAFFSSSGLLETRLSSEKPEVVNSKNGTMQFLSIKNPAISFWKGSFHFRANSISIKGDQIEVKIEPKKLEEDSYSAPIKVIILPKTENILNIFGRKIVKEFDEEIGIDINKDQFEGKGQEFVIKGIEGKDCFFKIGKLNIVNFENIEVKSSTTQTNGNGDSEKKKVEGYNQKLRQRIIELDCEYSEIVYNQRDAKLARLVELERDNLPEAKEQLKIIAGAGDSEEKKLLRELKEKEEGNAGNETIEKDNQVKINNFLELLKKKRAAIQKLEEIIQQTSPSKPTEPNEPSPNNNSPKPENNPVVDNSENSSQNIQEIAQASLEEAQKKGKVEINELLARYGVKSSELTASLWENQAHWEQYLTNLSTSEKVSEFVKKMKVEIIKKSSENQQKLLSDEVSLETVHEQTKQQIQENIPEHWKS